MGSEHKIKQPEEVSAAISGRRAVMASGVFDIVHPGHIRHLAYAKSKGDVLIANVTCDEHIQKGEYRPHFPEELRAMNLAALECVDYVVIDRNPTPLENISLIRPAYFAKGYEYDASNPRTAEEIRVLESYGGEMIFTPGDVVYSSSKLIEATPPKVSTEKLLAFMDGEGIKIHDLYQALEKIKGISVHVVGDTIVDSYTQCATLGAMAKTPTISLRYESKADFIGGAGVVAKHLSSAGAKVEFSTVLGSDPLAGVVDRDLIKAGVRMKAFQDGRVTTNKNVIVSGNHHLLKIDRLDNRPINDDAVRKLRKRIAEVETDILIFSDFRHGIFNRHTIPGFTEAIPANVFKCADSQVASRWGNILDFEGFDLITPNEREARFSMGDQDSGIKNLAAELHKKSKCKTLILKLGDKGILTFRTARKGRHFFALDSFAEEVVDAVGAGDALLAYASLSMKATGNELIASILGSMAASIECECEGNIPVKPEQVKAKIDKLRASAEYST